MLPIRILTSTAKDAIVHRIRISSSFVWRKTVSCNFITLHHAYFIITCFIFSGIFYGASRPLGSVSYTDSLFLVISSMTLT